MRRKVVKQGHNAMTLTLPAAWIKENNIRAGDELDAEAKGRDLVIRTASVGGVDRTTFKIIGNGEFLHRHLGVLYRLGYDEIRVEFSDPSMVGKIQYEIEDMLGFEIVDQGKDYCIIKSIATGLEKEFDNILRKIFLNILYYGEHSLTLIKNNNIGELKSLLPLSNVNNRLPNFCQRMLKREGYKDYRKTILVYVMVGGLEQVADYYQNIINYLLSLKKEPKIGSDVVKIYGEINKLFEFYYGLFYSFDSNGISKIKEECLNTINTIREIIEKKNGADSVLLLNLNLIVERIYHMTESLI